MIIFANNAVTTLAVSLLSSQTTLQVLATTGELFPVPGVGEYFKLTLEDRRNRTIEITHCTGRAGDVLTIVRAQEDTLALDFAVGSTVANRFTRDSADAILDQVPSPNPWYLGPFAVAPTLDNEGDPLVAGMKYFNTVDNIEYTWTGASWVDVTGGGTGVISSASGVYLLVDPSALFDGIETDFDLRYTDYAAATQTPDVTIAEQFLVFLDGVRLKPGDDYTIPVLGTISFDDPPTADQVFTGVWVALTTATDGVDGSTWYNGAGAPAGGLGIVGDYYLNNLNGDVYEKTDVATWTLLLNIQGPAGSGTGDMLRAVYDPDFDGKVVSAASADVAPWAGLTGVPVTFPPDVHTHDFADLTAKPTTILGYGITDFVSLGDAEWAQLVHTHAFADLTGKPTTIAGYGITDFVSLGDAEWAQLVHTHAWGDITGEPTTIAGYGITDFVSLGDAEWAQLVHTHAQADVTNLVSDLALKAPLASPAFTGNPTAPNQTAGDNDTSIANTAFVEAARVILAAAAAADLLTALAADKVVPENAQTGTTYTLVLTDAGKMVSMSNASAITLTVPTNASVAFPVNTRIDLLQLGAGNVTVSPTGITLQSSGSKQKLTGQYSGATLWKKATDTWVLIGDIKT